MPGQVVNKSELARILGVSPREMTRLIKEGLPCSSTGKKGVAVQIDTADAIEWLCQRAIRRDGGKKTERGRLASAQADKVELENEQRRGELVLASHVAETIYTMGSAVVSQIDAMPGRLANELAGISDPARVRARLLDEARTIRAAVADVLEQRADALAAVPDARTDLEASAAA